MIAPSKEIDSIENKLHEVHHNILHQYFIMKFLKTKTEHHLLPEFYKLILEIEKQHLISRIIPGRISRQQKGSSDLRFKISYNTTSGIKCIMSKGATAQELFIICNDQDTPTIIEYIKALIH